MITKSHIYGVHLTTANETFINNLKIHKFHAYSRIHDTVTKIDYTHDETVSFLQQDFLYNTVALEKAFDVSFPYMVRQTANKYSRTYHAAST